MTVQGGMGVPGRDQSNDPVTIGIDIGTTSIRAIAFDTAGRKLAVGARPTPTRRLETGGEYDPEEIWSCALGALSEVGSILDGRHVAGIAVASIGESVVLLDEGLRPLAPFIVWSDRRSEAEVDRIVDRIGRDRIFGISGHAPEYFFTLPKLMWMRDHWPEAVGAARHILMMADWIAFRLSGEMATDPTLASRTLYFDIASQQWSDEMLALAGLNSGIPAPVAASGTSLGPILEDVAAAAGLAGSPMIGVGGHDHVLGAFASGLTEPGTAINSIGTAEFLVLATEKPLADPETIRRGYVQGAIARDRRMSYVGGGIFNSGGAMEWARALIGGPSQEQLIAEAAEVPPGSHGVVFLPGLGGGSPPEPDPYGHGAFVGLTPRTTGPRLYRAVLEGLAMQSRMILDGMAALDGVGAPRELRLIGGTSRNRLFLSIKASALGRPITVIDEPEATALGAALLGGIAGGAFHSLEAALRGLERGEVVVEPDESCERYDRIRAMVFEEMHGTVRPLNKGLHALTEER